MMHTIDPSSSADPGFATSAESFERASGASSSDFERASDGNEMQEVIWIGAPGAGESAAMDHTFENVRLAEACVCKTRDQVSQPSS